MSESSSSSPRQKIKPVKAKPATPVAKPATPVAKPVKPESESSKSDSPVKKKAPVKSQDTPVPTPAKALTKSLPNQPKKVTKIEYSEDSDSEDKKRDRREVESQDKRVQKKQEITKVVCEISRGDKLVKVSKDYVVKPDDSIIVIDSSVAVKIHLCTITSSGKGDQHISKRLTIKAVRGLLTHKIICSSSNNFEADNTRKELVIVGQEVVRLQSGGSTWYIM